MAQYNIEIQKRNSANNSWDQLYPVTKASNVVQDPNNRFVTDAEKNNWNGKSNLSLGETSGTAYRGDRGKIAYDHSQSSHAPSNAQPNQTISAGNGMNFTTTSGNVSIAMGTPSTITSSTSNSITSTSHTHALTVTKSDVGLSAVQNYDIATQAEAKAMTSNIKYVTPLRVKEAIDLGGVVVGSSQFNNKRYTVHVDEDGLFLKEV